jgi:hypothetical protein
MHIDAPWREAVTNTGLAGLPQERRQHQAMARRLKKELADVEFRIVRGLDSCDQFFDHEQVLECRYSRSKSFFLDAHSVRAPLDVYFRSLKANNNVIQIDFCGRSDEEYTSFAQTICDLPSTATSIRVFHPEQLPPIQCDTPLFIHNFTGIPSLETFLNNDQSLARTRDTYIFMSRTKRWRVAVSFIGPPSGNLILRLKHRAREPNISLTVSSTSFALTIPESLTIDDINLRPIGNSSSPLSFVPNTRNNLILQTSSESPMYTHDLQDLQLLDEDGNPYGQPSRRNISTTEFDTLTMPDDHESEDSELERDIWLDLR